MAARPRRSARLLQVDEVAGAFHHDQLRARDAARHLARQLRRVDRVLVAADDERRHADCLDRSGAILRHRGLDGLQVRFFVQSGNALGQFLVGAGPGAAAEQLPHGVSGVRFALDHELADLVG